MEGECFGGVRLIHGDCLEIMPRIPAGSVDCIITDLPYGTTACAWDTVIPFAPLWEAYKRLVKANGAVVLFGSQPFTSALVMSNPKMYKHEWIWDKRLSSGYLNAKIKPLCRHESVLVFGGERVTYNPQMRTGELRMKGHTKAGPLSKCYGKHKHSHSFNDQYYPTSILDISNANRAEKIHPTQKPVALLEYLIRTYTNPGDTVLDSCMGSASTAIACMRTGRKFIGIEKDDTYFEVACQRVKDEQRQGRLFTV